MEDSALPAAPIWSDIKSFDFSKFSGRVDGIVGGYPCQPWSTANQDRLGEADPRNLWPYIEAGIEATRPVWCFFENVAAHLSMGFESPVGESLRRLGYEIACTLVTAESVGAPHKRERLFILAYSRALGDAGSKGLQGRLLQRVAGTQGRQVERRVATGSSRALGHYPPGPADPGWHEVPERLFPAASKSRLHGLAHGMAGWLDLRQSERVRLAGNGVVPGAAAVAWQQCWAELS